MKTGGEANALPRSGRFTQMQVQPVEHYVKKYREKMT